MILHLVTDRRRLAPNADAETEARCLLEQVRHAAAAGLDVIQVRERDLDGRALAALVSQCVAVTRGTPTRIVVNERLDVALACGADGVHLRGDAFAAIRVRASVGARFLIGRSVRSAEEAAGAGPLDYLIAGTVWATPSKPAEHSLLGADGLRAVVNAAHAPVLAIGGVALARLGELRGTGVAGVAAIGAWMSETADCRAVALHDVAQAFRARRDLANMDVRFPHS